MPARRDTARAVARRASRLLPGRARSALARRFRSPAVGSGAVSVVLLCEPVDLPRLPATLAALREDPAALEVLVAPVGAAAADAAGCVGVAHDARVRLLAAASGWQQAAAAGAGAAAGRYLALRRACDTHLPGALAALAASLDRSGSDLATGAVRQRGRPARWLELTTAAAHGSAATGVAPRDRPDLAADLGLGNKLLRTDRWRAEQRRLDAGDDWLLSPTLAAHLAAADRVDVLPRPVQEHVAGHGVRPFAASPSPLRHLESWEERAEAVARVWAGGALAAGWRRHVRDVALPDFLVDAERATADQWGRLRALAAREAGSADAATGPVSARTLLWLAAADRREDVEALARDLDRLGGDVPTTVDPDTGDVVAAWPALPPDLPPAATRLGAAETPLEAAVLRRREREGGAEVDLVVGVRHVDLPGLRPRLTAGPPGGPETEVAAAPDPLATRWGGSRFSRALAVTVAVPAEVATLRLRLAAGPLDRSASVALADPHPRPAAPDRRVVVTGIALDGEDLVVDVEPGSAPLRLVDEADREVGRLDGGHPQRRLALRDELFGRPRLLPTGFYRVVAGSGPPVVADGLRGLLPLEQVGPHHRLRATIGPVGGLLLHLGPPLTDEEQGPYAQERLVASYRDRDARPDPSVLYFESYAGRSATDSPRAIHDELRRRDLGHTTYWGVLDHAQWVPPGAIPLLLRSRDWYDVLARAGGLVVNTDVEEWFRRRPGQVLLQTFHGYPAKGMGRGQWEAEQLPPRRVAVLRARGVDTWSVILTPTPEMTRHYREQYDYTGPALEHGYPRDDDLTGPEAQRRRAATRELLGIGERTAVLYAPTWREHLATRARRADLGDHLDVTAAARSLGESHVLLLRGHRFHHRRDHGPGVVDVTEHPEVNDLILAADAAVLDYSSLRFDFALTGRPMVFLVPDLADYGAGSRRFLFPFEDSAPGPLVEDTAAVVEQVRDVAALRERWADRIAEFNATYHPHQDGHASSRVVDGLLRLLRDPST